jgi:hypothetical protein
MLRHRPQELGRDAAGARAGRVARRACPAPGALGCKHGPRVAARAGGGAHAGGAGAAAGAEAARAAAQRVRGPSGRRAGRGRLSVAAESASQPSAPTAQRPAGSVANTVATPAGDVRLGSFLSTEPSARSAVAEAVAAIRAGFGGGGAPFEPELAIVFAAAAYGDGLEEVVPALRELVPSLRHVFGATVRAAARASEGRGAGGVLLASCRCRGLAGKWPALA